MCRAARSAWPWAALPFAAVVAVDPSGLAPFGPVKWAVVPALVFAGTAVLAADGTRAPRPRLPPGAWREWALAAFVAWAAVTAVFGLDGLYAWTGTPERHFGVIAWLLVLLAWRGGRALDEPAQRLVLASATATAGALGAWAGAEALGWRPLHLVGIGDRPVGPLGSSAFLGAAAVLVTPVAIGAVMHTGGRLRALSGVASALGLVALAASGARAAWVGAAVAALATVVASRQRRVVAITAAGCAVVVVALALATGVAGRASSVVTDRDGGARGRLDEWRVAVRVVAAHPIVGTGPEGYRLAFGRAVDARYERDHGRNPVPDRAHSALLDVAATTGLVGLLLYVLAVGAAAAAALNALRNANPVVAGAAVGVLAYFAQSLFLFPIAELEPVAWLLAGLCAAASPASAWSTGASSPRRQRRMTAALAGVLAVVMLTAGALDVVADRRAKQQLVDVAKDSPSRLAVAVLRPDQVRYWLVKMRADESDGSLHGLGKALADVDDALRVSSRDPVARGEKARLLVARARRSNASAQAAATARAYLERVAAGDPRNAEVLLRLGVARDLDGDQPGAIAAWLRAEHLAPRSAAASSNLAVAYARTGRTDAARAAAQRALRRDPHNAPAREVLDSLKRQDGT